MTVWIMNIIEEDGNELSIYLNSEDLIYIQIGEGVEDMYAKNIVLNKDDATNLRNELENLIKKMQ